MNRQTFLDSLGHIADAPGGIDKLRRLVLELAVRGALSEGEPGEWSTRRLDGAAEVTLGQSPPGASYNDVGDGDPFFQGKAEFTDEYAEVRNYTTAGTKFAERDDILLSVRAPIGPTNWAPVRCAIGRGLAALRAREGVDQRYLHVAVRSAEADLAAQGTGTTFRAITGKKLKAHEISVPTSEAEQHHIVERVDELMALCDELEAQQAARAEARSALTAATLHRVSGAETADDLRSAATHFAERIDLHLAPGEGDLAALKRLRQAILDLAVRGRLTRQDPADEPAAELLDRIAAERDRLVKAKEIRKPKPVPAVEPADVEFPAPAGWAWCRLGHLLVSNEAGWSPVCPQEPRSHGDQWGVLKLSALSWGRFRGDEHKVLAPGLEPRRAIEVNDGDFLMSRANTAALVGKSVVVDSPPPRLMMSDLIVRLGFVHRVTAEYINLLNGTTSVRALYATASKGTSDTMRKLSRDQILATPVPLPPLAEQARIVDRVAALNAICDQMEQQLLAAKFLRGDLAASIAAHVVTAARREAA